jgi:hypothetical protein
MTLDVESKNIKDGAIRVYSNVVKESSPECNQRLVDFIGTVRALENLTMVDANVLVEEAHCSKTLTALWTKMSLIRVFVILNMHQEFQTIRIATTALAAAIAIFSGVKLFRMFEQMLVASDWFVAYNAWRSVELNIISVCLQVIQQVNSLVV